MVSRERGKDLTHRDKTFQMVSNGWRQGIYRKGNEDMVKEASI